MQIYQRKVNIFLYVSPRVCESLCMNSTAATMSVEPARAEIRLLALIDEWQELNSRSAFVRSRTGHRTACMLTEAEQARHELLSRVLLATGHLKH